MIQPYPAPSSPGSQRSQTRKSCRVRNFFLILLALSVLALGIGACSGDEKRADPGGYAGAGVRPDNTCEEGDRRQCGFKLHQEGDIITCFRGVKYCDKDGEWGDCVDGEVTREKDPSSKEQNSRLGLPSSRNPLAVSDVDAEDCEDDCDPACMHFIEGDPDLGPPPVIGGLSTPFPGVEGDECAHGLCTAGAALNADCDDCVDKICNQTVNGIAPDSACCTTGWDSDCVAQVYTKCLNTPPPLEFGLCDFGVYSLQGTTFANRPVAGASIGSKGNLTLGTDLGGTANNPPCSAGSTTPPGNTSPRMIVTGGDLSIPSQNGNNCKTIDITDGVYVAGSAFAQAGGGTTYKGNWHVGGTLNLSGGNSIIGNVRAGSTPTGVTITGTTTAPSPPPVINIPTTLPTRTVTCSGADGAITLDGGKSASKGFGNYSNVALTNGNNVLGLTPGTYTIQTLSAGGGNAGTPNVIRLVGTAADRWDISVCNNSDVQNSFEIQDSTGAKLTDPKRLVLYFNNNFQVGTNSHLGGIIWVPNGTFTSSNNTKVNGALWAKSVVAGTDMNTVQISKADCEGLNIPGTTPGGGGTCPIVPTGSGGLPPSEVEPCESGLDCQMNQRCTDVATATSCAHSKCLPGASLVSSCDTCVAKVCAANASCCSSAWTQQCVDQVEKLCDVECGGVNGCAHDACTTGSRLVQGCDTGAAGSGNCTDAVCTNASFAYCCDPNSAQGWDAACVTRAKAVCSGTPSGAGGKNACSYAITGSSVALGSGAHNNNGTTPVHLQAASTVTTKNLSGVNCSVTAASTLSTNTSWTSAAPNRGSVTVSSGATLTMGAGTYNVNSLTTASWSNSKITFSGNVTLNICGNLTLSEQTFLVMSAAPSTVTINVKGNVSFLQGAQVQGLSTGADLLRLKLYAAGNFSMGPNATTRGVFLGGGATSSISMQGGNVNEAIHQGVLWANGSVNMTLNWSTWPAVLNTIPVATCLTSTSGLIPAPPAGCPITTPGPTFSGDDDGLCVSNDDGWEQTTCSGFDLALGYMCGSTVPICNHGSASFPGGTVAVGYYSVEDSPKFAVESPGSATGSCSAVMPAIAAGECTNLTCSIPTGKDYTVMVDPLDALSECSRLDNWSWRDDDFACGTTSTTSTVNYEYEAVCTDDATTPRWKNLNWLSTVPSGSSITFSAKVAESLSALDSATYTTLTPTAKVGSPDTTDCVLPGCSVPLTTQLGLNSNQDRFLSLQIVTDHSGGSPTIDDWTVSYTCQYDQ